MSFGKSFHCCFSGLLIFLSLDSLWPWGKSTARSCAHTHTHALRISHSPLHVNTPHTSPFCKLWRNERSKPIPDPSLPPPIHLVWLPHFCDSPVWGNHIDGGVLLLPDDPSHLPPLPKILQLVQNVKEFLGALLSQVLEHLWRPLCHPLQWGSRDLWGRFLCKRSWYVRVRLYGIRWRADSKKSERMAWRFWRRYRR